MASSQIEMYFRHFSQRGFITFTIIDHSVEEFMNFLETKEIKYRLEQFKTFAVVSLVGNMKAKTKKKRKKKI